MSTVTGTPARIHLKGMGRIDENALSAGVVRPGQLLRLNVDGNVIPHDIPFGQAERAFALEDALQGRPISTDYASGERVTYVLAVPGDEIYGWLALGEVAAPGDFLASDGAGHFVVSAESGAVGQDALAVALEVLDNSESDDENARIRIRVL